jgi:hypothetical protein
MILTTDKIMNKLPEALKGKKGSDTFLDYVEPYLLSYIQSTGKTDFKSIEEILRVPWMVWNTTVLEGKPGNTVNYIVWIRSLINHFPTEIKDTIDWLKTRKETLFSQYDYLFSKYKIYYNDKGEIRFSMETRSADVPDPHEFCSL